MPPALFAVETVPKIPRSELTVSEDPVWETEPSQLYGADSFARALLGVISTRPSRGRVLSLKSLRGVPGGKISWMGFGSEVLKRGIVTAVCESL